MPAVPIYTASPINAAKASGITPQTAQPGSQAPASDGSNANTAEPTSTYPAAAPGARPTLPEPTGVPRPPAALEPTPTRSHAAPGPPPPQPGQVPVPPGGQSSGGGGSGSDSSSLPPPPRAGEAPRTPQAPSATAMPMPQQFSYAPPGSSGLDDRGSSTVTTAPMASPLVAGPQPTALGGGGGRGADFSHPPGYHQNVHASEFSSAQRAAHEAAVAEHSSGLNMMPSSGEPGDEGVWGAAKKWAMSAGESLAAAEQEVWKRINKD